MLRPAQDPRATDALLLKGSMSVSDTIVHAVTSRGYDTITHLNNGPSRRATYSVTVMFEDAIHVGATDGVGERDGADDVRGSAVGIDVGVIDGWSDDGYGTSMVVEDGVREG